MAVKYNPERHHRQSIRLSGHDYSRAGFYFITTCVHQRQCLFGDITAEQMQLNELGDIVDHEWRRSQQIRPEFQFHEWVVMPNHFHAIIEIPAAPVGTPTGRPPQPSTAPKTSPNTQSPKPSICKNLPTNIRLNRTSFQSHHQCDPNRFHH